MNDSRKIKLIITFVIALIICISNISFAANDIEKANNTTNTTNAVTNKSEEKSSNANLSILGIRPHDFTGFKYGTTTYEVTVPKDTKTVEVYATAQDEKSTVTGTGKKELEDGKNVATVVVTAENGNKRTYTINIIRENDDETVENKVDDNSTSTNQSNQEENEGLLNLVIQGVTLSPKFQTNVYEYTTKYIGEKKNLNIEVKPTRDTYKVEIIGNEDLKEGENVITILVSEVSGDNIATYQVTVNKSLVDEEAIAKEEAEKKASEQKKIIIGAVVAVIILAIIVFIIIRRKRKNIAEEFSGVPFYGLNNEEADDDNNEEEIPRALNKDKEEVEENSPKDKLRNEFLDNYNKDTYYDDYEEEKPAKKRKKGKRFK